MPKAAINLMRYVTDKRGNMKLKNDVPVREFHKCISIDMTDELVEKLYKASCDERKEMLKDVFEENGSTDAEIFVRCSYEPEGFHAPTRTYDSGRGKYNRSNSNEEEDVDEYI